MKSWLTTVKWHCKSGNPERYESGETNSVFNEATEISVAVDVDGEVTVQDFGSRDEVRIEGARSLESGSTVQIEITADNTSEGELFGRTDPFIVDGESEPRPLMLIATPRSAHQLLSDLPDGRIDAALCASEQGILIAGGRTTATLPATLSAGTLLISAAERGVIEGPGLPTSRYGAGCALLTSGAVMLVGGCSSDGVALDSDTYARADQAATGNVLTGPEVPAGQDVCGASAATLGTGAAFQYGARVEWREADGDVTDSVDLPGPRHFADMVAHEDGVFVSLGYTDIAQTTVATGTTHARRSGPSQMGGSGPLAIYLGDVVQMTGTTIRRLTGEGGTVTSFNSVTDFSPADMAASDEGVFAALDSDGGRVLLVTGEGQTTVPLNPARPTGRIFVQPGGAFVVAGGAPGAHVIVP